MGETTNQTQEHLDNVFNAVKEFMPGVAKRLAFNYLLLFGVTLLVSLTLVPVLMRYIPLSTARTIGFAVNLVWLVNGWRFFENRNRATALFVLYTRFSRTRRDLEQLLSTEKAKSEDVTAQVNALEATAEAFLQAAQEQQVEVRQST